MPLGLCIALACTYVLACSSQHTCKQYCCIAQHSCSPIMIVYLPLLVLQQGVAKALSALMKPENYCTHHSYLLLSLFAVVACASLLTRFESNCSGSGLQEAAEQVCGLAEGLLLHYAMLQTLPAPAIGQSLSTACILLESRFGELHYCRTMPSYRWSYTTQWPISSLHSTSVRFMNALACTYQSIAHVHIYNSTALS